MSTIYDSPDAYNAEILAEIGDGHQISYKYLVVFRHRPTGRLFYGDTAGCSCTSPFDEYFFVGPDSTDLLEVVDSTWIAFQHAVMDFPAEGADKHKLLRAALLALAQRGTMVFPGPILEDV